MAHTIVNIIHHAGNRSVTFIACHEGPECPHSEEEAGALHTQYTVDTDPLLGADSLEWARSQADECLRRSRARYEPIPDLSALVGYQG